MDEARYGQLLAEIRPALIETPEEHDRMLTTAESLMEKGPALTAEEQRVLELLVFLIKSFEDSVLAEESGDDDEDEPEPVNALPHETLKRLMEARSLQPPDIQHVFGNPAACRDALAGTRKITRGQARDLGQFFQVPYKLFLE
jgi:HTH-type transcriptional regulator/antitoxin HigA